MILIENELTFVAIPKCASVSIHNALEASNFDIKPTFYQDVNVDIFHGKFKPPTIGITEFYNENKRVKIHTHQTISSIYNYLNFMPETFVIKRDYCKRFISCFNYIFNFWIAPHYELDYKDGEITNDFIYKYFNDDVLSLIKQLVGEHKTYDYDLILKEKIVKPLIENYSLNKNKKEIINNKLYDNTYINFKIFNSQELWKSGYIPTYEFHIHELNKLENFLKERYNKKITIGKDNSTDFKSKINIVENQKLRDWVWNKFEKHYFTKKIF